MKRYRVVFDLAALDDLAGVLSHIVETSHEEAALAYLNRVEKFCSGLDVMSERFPIWKAEEPNLRVATFKRSLSIAYEVRADSVVILRVLARGRDRALALG
jgi:toxin ParE1/3/4